MIRRGLFALVLGALFVSAAQAQEASGGASADLPIAVQMYTLRDYGSTEEQFGFAADSGYSHVETVGTHDLTPTR